MRIRTGWCMLGLILTAALLGLPRLALADPAPVAHATEVSVVGVERDRSAWLGASARATDRNLVDDPRWLALVQSMQLAFLRYPGGTVANFWDWRRGNFLPGGRSFLSNLGNELNGNHPDLGAADAL